jgi:membrane protease YdiL (CAAX protease family)
MLFGLLLLTSLSSSFLYRMELAPDAYLEAAVVLVDAAIIAVFAVRHRRDVWPLLARGRCDARMLALVGTAALALFVLGNAYFELLEALGFRMFSYWAPYDAVGWPAWTAIVLVCVYPAFFEEVAFRGVLMAGLDRAMRPLEALLVQAAAFSVLHLLPAVFFSHFGMGLLFGYLRRRTNSLWAGMLLHGSWNAWVLVEEAITLGT